MTHGYDLTDKVVIVTGSTQGLGRAMAQGFAEAGATVAVKVTELPETDGLALLARVVVVASLFTTFCTKARLVLAEKLELPWYSAVML